MQHLMGARVAQSDILNTPEAMHVLSLPQMVAAAIVEPFQRHVNTTDNFTMGAVYQDNLALMQANAVTDASWVHANTGAQAPYPPRLSALAAQFNEALAAVENFLIGAP